MVPAHTVLTQVKDEYLSCVAKHKGKADECTDVVKAYLTCRMQQYAVVVCALTLHTSVTCSNLMAPQELAELGLSDKAAKAGKAGSGSSREKTKRGFIAGLQ